MTLQEGMGWVTGRLGTSTFGNTRPRVVAEPDTEVLDLQRLLLMDLRHRKGQREQQQKSTLDRPKVSKPIPPAS